MARMSVARLLSCEFAQTDCHVCQQAAAEHISKLHSGIDLLINNAGIAEGVDEPSLEM